MLSRLRNLPQSLLTHLPSLIPTSCALCGASHSEALCDNCGAKHFSRPQHRCACCAIPISDKSGLCGECLKSQPAYDATIVAAEYTPPIDQLVLALKFGNRLELAPLLSRMLLEAAQHAASPLPSLITAVPLGPTRLVERGFNQSLEIARPLARALGATLDPKLTVRQRDTRAQALLHPDERNKNIRHAFVVPANAIDRVRGQHIGVVDDVMTTGETLNELAATLKRFGAARVTNFVFARTSQR